MEDGTLLPRLAKQMAYGFATGPFTDSLKNLFGSSRDTLGILQPLNKINT